MALVVYQFGDFSLHPGRCELSRMGRRLKVERKPLELLILLVTNHGKVVNREEIARCLWTQEVFVDIEHGINTAIRKLRQTLGDSSDLPRYVQTISGSGYKFIAPVTIVETDVPGPAQSLPDPVDPPPVEPEFTTAASVPAVNRPSRTLWLITALCTFLLVVFAAFTLGSHHRPGDRNEHATIHSLAVLPLQNLSGDTTQDYFAAGMTDELTMQLAHIEGLRVVSRTSAVFASQSQRSLPQIAEALNVEAVVEGSVLRSGNKVRITAQLIDARNDKHLWSQSFEGPASDILSLQDTVAHEIATRTRVALTGADRTRLSNSRTIKPEAHDDYLRGLYFIQRREPERAAQYFQNAIDLEPTYAPAWAGLAQAIMLESVAGSKPAKETMAPAMQAAKRAIELDPESGEAYIALGANEMTYSLDWSATERDLRRGIALSPGDPLGHAYLSLYLTTVNRPDEAVVAARRALDLDPLGFFTNRNLGAILYYDRRYDESRAALRRAAEIAPDRFEFVEGWNAAIDEVQGHYADAVDAHLHALSANFPPNELKGLRAAFAAGGWRGYQQALIRFLLPKGSTCYSGDLAMSYLRLGQIPTAFRWFQREADGYCVFSRQLSSDPLLDPVRHDPHYLAYQDRLHLPH